MDALILIDQYHRQNADAIIPAKPLTPIKAWIALQGNNISQRLTRALIGYDYYGGPESVPFPYMETITKVEFRRLRGVGGRTWAEFEELRGY